MSNYSAEKRAYSAEKAGYRSEKLGYSGTIFDERRSIISPMRPTETHTIDLGRNVNLTQKFHPENRIKGISPSYESIFGQRGVQGATPSFRPSIKQPLGVVTGNSEQKSSNVYTPAKPIETPYQKAFREAGYPWGYVPRLERLKTPAEKGYPWFDSGPHQSIRPEPDINRKLLMNSPGMRWWSGKSAGYESTGYDLMNYHGRTTLRWLSPYAAKHWPRY